MLLNEFIFQKLEIFAWEFIVISLFYTTINPNERQFIVATLPDTRLITEPRALLHLAFYLVNLKGIVAPCPRARLLIVEIVMCVAFLERQIKGIHSKSVL